MPEDVERRRAKREMLPICYRQANPSRNQGFPELTMGEKRDASPNHAEAHDQVVSAGRDVCGHFAVRTAVLEDIPIRPPAANVLG